MGTTGETGTVWHSSALQHFSSMARACIVCGVTEKLRKCSRCKQVHYCGREHQLAHWKEHKANCTPAAKTAVSKPASAKPVASKTAVDPLKPSYTEEELAHYEAMGETMRSMELGYKASSAWNKISSGSATAEDYATHEKFTALARHFNC